MAKKGLGRGLDVLLGDGDPGEARPRKRKGLDTLPLESVFPDAKQPRKTFDDEAIAELAASIREKGLLQPIVVRPHPKREGQFLIVAGERRWRASQQAQLHDVPVVIRDFTDQEAAEIALVENLQRVDLNPIEEAEAYHQLAETHGHSQAEIADAVGKSRSHVANMMRLVKLPTSVRDLVAEGALSMGHARAILSSADPEVVAKYVVERGLSVRDTEAYARASIGNIDALKHGGKKPAKPKAPSQKTGPKSADIQALEQDLEAALGLEVVLDHDRKNGGTLVIHYGDLDQLDEVCRRLMATGI